MPGIYIHIPFCRKACHYCNFHFSTSLRLKNDLLHALLTELDTRRDYLDTRTISSVYLGGGTPSLLEVSELEELFNKISQYFQLETDAEITLEANPDDLTPAYVNALYNNTPVNRLSVGIQSFHEADLRWMNRAHDARQAREALENALRQGFNDLSIDLIYGTPGMSDDHWAENLHLAFTYGIPHLSCYALTVEEGTALAHFVRKGKTPPIDEERAARQFEYLIDAAEGRGYEHYEISNFALPGRHARHNSSYWLGDTYLGLGPSAHSYDGRSRQWNLAHNPQYVESLQQGILPFEKEDLTPIQRYNEYLLTRLRTKWGAEQDTLKNFGAPLFRYFEQTVQPFLENGTVEFNGSVYRLTRKGKLLADALTAELFAEEDIPGLI